MLPLTVAPSPFGKGVVWEVCRDPLWEREVSLVLSRVAWRLSTQQVGQEESSVDVQT